MTLALSNPGSDIHVGIYRRLCRLFSDLWPGKTPADLAVTADVSTRQAERVLGGHSRFSGDSLINLLRGDHGGKVLQEIMRGCPAKWWRRTDTAMRLAELERGQELQRQEIEQLRRQAAAD